MACDKQEKYFTYIRDQVELCMLPALQEDLDTVQLLQSHFKTYHSLLGEALPQLFDLLKSNEDVLFSYETNQEVRAQLILLLCELTASPSIYRLNENSSSLLQYANKILLKLTSSCQKTEESYVFNYYEQRLHKDCWKRQIGAIHGFVSYLENRYAVNDAKMSTTMITFSVAVGLNVRQCFQPEYKQLGIRIFSHILRHSRPADIQHMNIQGVIYDHVFRDAHSLDPVDETAAKWDCLCLCLDHFTELNGLMWNQCDDMLERLIQNVSLSSNVEMSICLLDFITKLSYYFTLNKEEIKALLESDLTQLSQIPACLDICASLNVSTSYRWAKSILQLLQLESEKLLHSAESCAKLLIAMQRCYLVCILPIPLQTLQRQLSEFYCKFVAVLLESLSAHKKVEPILMLTQQFIQIFLYQLNDCPSSCQDASILKDFSPALKILSVIIDK